MGKKGSIPDAVRKYSFVALKDPSKVFHPLPGVHPKRPSDKALVKYLQNECKTLSAKEKAGGKRSAPKKRETKNSNKNKSEGEAEEADSEELKKANAPKKPQSAYFAFSAIVRAEPKSSDPTLKVTEIAKESGKRWRALGAAEKKEFTDRAAKAKKEYSEAMDAYLASEEGKWLAEDQKNKETAKAEKKKEKKTKTKKDATAKGPKKPQSAYFLYLASVRADIKTEFGISKASDVAREGGKKLKEEWKVNVELFKAAQAKAEAQKAETEAETEE